MTPDSLKLKKVTKFKLVVAPRASLERLLSRVTQPCHAEVKIDREQLNCIVFVNGAMQ